VCCRAAPWHIVDEDIRIQIIETRLRNLGFSLRPGGSTIHLSEAEALQLQFFAGFLL
jgi:hypothetical protein